MGVNRYIITGGPGSGKSTLLDALIREGIHGFPEVSRILIREQQAIGGNLCPWDNMVGFASECYLRMKQQIKASANVDMAFFDRGIPDVTAYLKCSNLPVPPDMKDGLKWYNTTVFICPPWEDIFVNDPQRPETFEHSVCLFRHLVKEYKRQGADLIELPLGSVEERLNAIVSEIEKVCV